MPQPPHRPFEAQAVPCSSCGAPLPLDPLSTQAFCPQCRSVSHIPQHVRAGADAYRDALHSAEHVRQEHLREAAGAHRAAAESGQRQAGFVVAIVIVVGTSVLPLLVGAVALGIGLIHELFEGVFEDWLVLLIDVGFVAGCGLFALVLLLSFVLVRRRRKHQQRARLASAAGYSQAAAFVGSPVPTSASSSHSANCSVCGAPVHFEVGQQRATCAYCRSTVTPGPGVRQGMVGLALQETELAELQRYRALRQKLRSDLKTRRTRAFYIVGIVATNLLILIPIGLAVVFLALLRRRFTWGVEDAVDEFALTVGSNSERGVDLPFDWLDAYWVAKGPANALHVGGPLEFRWSAIGTYAGRPILLTAVSDWRDAVASHVALLLAHPAPRTHQVSARACMSPAAHEARQLGYEPSVDEAGVALEARSVPAERLSDANLHRLLACAYGLSGTA